MKYILFIIFLFGLAAPLRSAIFYLDPINGDLSNDGTIDAPWSSFEEVINANYIVSNQYSPLPYDPATSALAPKNPTGYVHAGDTLVLMDGLHGEAVLTSYINTTCITVTGMPNHNPILKKVHLRACKNWRFEHVKISSEPYGVYLNHELFFIESHGYLGPSSHIEVHHCDIYSADHPWQTADEWNENMSNGLTIKADSVIATNNLIRNINMGLQAAGDFIEANHNQVINFAGDGMRIIGSNIVFKYNLIKNCYDVNENHDDGIQSWAQINGVVADDNQVIGNVIINSDDFSRPLNGPLQGIGCFDGMYNRWSVVNNLIIVDHWHGITFLGANDCEIINNTVLDLTPDITPGGSWIKIDNHKDGTPSSGCVAANNVANSFDVDGNSFNNVAFTTYQQYEDNFVDYANFDFHLLPSSELIDAADPDMAPEEDIEKNPRPSGDLPDIGAYEFPLVNASTHVPSKNNFTLYPNPFADHVFIEGLEKNIQLDIWDVAGNWVYSRSLDKGYSRDKIDLSTLPKGVFLLTIKEPENKREESMILIKN